MVELQTGWQAEIDKPHGAGPFAWLFSVPLVVNSSLNVVARVTTSRSTVTVSGLDYEPWSCDIGVIEDSPEDIPQTTLTLANHGGTLARFLESTSGTDGMIGRNIRAGLVNTQAPTAVSWFTFRIASATLSIESLTLDLQPANHFLRKIPQERFDPRRCRWKFAGPECGYVVNGAAAYTACDKTLPACVLRGQDMAARNLPVLQPERFGAFVSIPES